MKRMIVLTLGVVLAVPLFARAPRPPAHRHQPPRVPHHHHQPPRPHHHHGSAWGKGGRNFWPGFVGGVALGLATRAVAEPTTVVVHRPASTVVVQPAPVVVQPAPVVIQPDAADDLAVLFPYDLPGVFRAEDRLDDAL
jgi:hypothetical protein